MKLLLAFFMAVSAAVPDAWAAAPLKPGRYELVAWAEACAHEPKLVCATVDKGTRSERSITLHPSKWDAALRSAHGFRVVLTGRLSNAELTLEAAPRVFRSPQKAPFDNNEQVRFLR